MRISFEEREALDNLMRSLQLKSVSEVMREAFKQISQPQTKH